MHYHVTIDGDTLSWAWVEETRQAAECSESAAFLSGARDVGITEHDDAVCELYQEAQNQRLLCNSPFSD